MVDNRYRHAGIHLAGPNAGFGRMLLLSLGIHLLVAVFFAVGLRPPLRSAPPAYRVDLVSLPVAKPRAGDGLPTAPAPASLPSPPSVPSPPRPAPAKTAPKATVPGKEAKPTVKSATGKKPAKAPAPSSIDDDYDEVQANLRVMQMRRERDRRKQAAEAKIHQVLAEVQPSGSGAVGSRSKASGDQLGSAYEDWIQVHLRELWTFNRQQARQLDIEARLKLSFDARGQLVDYKFLKSSGNEQFDKSIHNAVLQLKRLPTAPERPLELTVTFNLKELLER